MIKIMLKKIIYLFLFVSINGSTVFAASVHRITDYHQTFFPCYNGNGDLRIAIRMYYLETTPYYVVVNPKNFSTETAPSANFKPRKTLDGDPGYFKMQELLATPYIKALVKYTSPPYVLQKYGITHAEKPVKGVFLTADM